MPGLGLKPGTVLTRTWHGVLHRVRVTNEGFDYRGERFGSLSEVARRITGTRWSGPLFFGLKGTDNQVAFTTVRYRKNPLVITGPGAGPAVTAAGVLNDLLRLT